MTDTVKAIPDGYEGATPYLSIKGAADATEFYKSASGATEVMRMAEQSGRIGVRRQGRQEERTTLFLSSLTPDA